MEHARLCQSNYPTVVNNIPKEKNVYSNSLLDYAKMDNTLSASQTDIGESSNIAQLAQTYSYNFDDPKYDEYACILAVLAQAAIDSSKRRFDVDIPREIRRIKQDMDVSEYKYPSFWLAIKKDFNRKNINKGLICPMNYLYDLELAKFRNATSTLPMTDFFVTHKLKANRNTCISVEQIINDYSLSVLNNLGKAHENDEDKYLLLRSDFNSLIDSLRTSPISKNYLGFMSWLLQRAFLSNPYVAAKSDKIKSTISKNRSLLLKILYTTSAKNLLKCFKNG